MHTLRTKTLSLALLFVALAGAVPLLASGGVVNVNEAPAQELALLPRVGPAVAQRIVEHREANGPFRAKEELMLVRGIGEKTFELLAPYVALEGKSTLKDKVRVPRAPKAEEAAD